MKRFLAMLLAIMMVISLFPTAAFATDDPEPEQVVVAEPEQVVEPAAEPVEETAPAEIEMLDLGTEEVELAMLEDGGAVTTQAEFEDACAATVSGGTIELGSGEFAIGPVDINGKTLIFKGQGAANTKIYIGNGGYDGNGGHGSNKTANMTFVDVTLDDLASDSGYLTGFTEAAGLTFRNVTFDVGFSNWGNKGGDVSFYNCIFNQTADGKYNVQELRSDNGTKYLFDGCTFNSTPGRFINAYKQGGATTKIEITVKDCTFNHTGTANTGKAAVNMKTGSNGCSIDMYLLGENKTFGVINGTVTGNPLFNDDEGKNGVVYQGTTKETAVKIWEAGAKVDTPAAAEDVTVQATENTEAGITSEIAQAISGNTAVTAEGATNVAEVEGVATLAITLERAVSEDNKVTSITFDVTPKNAAGEDVSYPDDPISFRLPLTDDFTAYAKVEHEYDAARYAEVKNDGQGNYCEVTADHFSSFTASPVETLPAASNEGGDFATVQAAINDCYDGYFTYGAYGDPYVYLLQNSNEEITLPEGINLYLKGHTFTGKINFEATNWNGQANVIGLAADEYHGEYYYVTTANCKINDTYYASLQDAINHASDGATIVCIEDVYQNINIPANTFPNGLTIKLDTYKYIYPQASDDTTPGIFIGEDNKVTISGTAITAADTEYEDDIGTYNNWIYNCGEKGGYVETVIENHGELKLDNVFVSVDYFDHNPANYGSGKTAVANSGKLELTGTTTVAAGSGTSIVCEEGSTLKVDIPDSDPAVNVTHGIVVGNIVLNGGTVEFTAPEGDANGSTFIGSFVEGEKYEEGDVDIKGGDFSELPRNEYLNEEAEIVVGEVTYVKAEEGNDPVVKGEEPAGPTGVAAIGTTGYETLAAAIAAVAEMPDKTATIVLLDNAVSDAYMSPVTIPAGDTITLDLHGKNITGTYFGAGITNNGDLTITDTVGGGKLAGNNPSISGTGELTIKGGIFEDAPSFTCEKLTITGGVFNTNESSNYALSINVDNPTENVSITGGTFNWTEQTAGAGSPILEEMKVISGGTFNHDPSENLAPGYAPKLIEETGLYETEEAPTGPAVIALAEDVSFEYNSLTVAIENAQNDAWEAGYGLQGIALLRDCAEDITLPCGVRIYTNGYQFIGEVTVPEEKTETVPATLYDPEYTKTTGYACEFGLYDKDGWVYLENKHEDTEGDYLRCYFEVIEAKAKIGNTYYPNLKAAIAAANDGDTITIPLEQEDWDGEGIYIAPNTFPTGLTIDFGKEYYHITSAAVDENGNDLGVGFFIGEGNKITFTSPDGLPRQGCIEMADSSELPYTTLVENKGELTMNNTELKGWEVNVDGVDVVLANSGEGKVTLQGKTSIATMDPNPGYNDPVEAGTVLLLKDNSTITVDLTEDESRNPYGVNGEIKLDGGKLIVTNNEDNKFINTTFTETENYSKGDVEIKNGTFEKLGVGVEVLPAEYFPEGKGLVDNGDGTYTVGEASAPTGVAEVGGVGYETLSEALKAGNGKTVTVLQDIVVADPEFANVPVNVTTTLDLNGFKVSGNNYDWGTIRVYGNLTIVDNSEAKTGKLLNDSFYEYAVCACGGTVTVESGYVQSILNFTDNDSKTDDCTIEVKGGTVGTVELSSGSATVTGGEVNKIEMPDALNAEVEVTGGKVDEIDINSGYGANADIEIGGTAEIGTIDASDNKSGKDVNVEVSGNATIEQPIELTENMSIDASEATTKPSVTAPEGYILVEKDGVYTAAKPVAQVGDTKYETLNDALAAAQESGATEIILLADVTVDEEISVSGSNIAFNKISGIKNAEATTAADKYYTITVVDGGKLTLDYDNTKTTVTIDANIVDSTTAGDGLYLRGYDRPYPVIVNGFATFNGNETIKRVEFFDSVTGNKTTLNQFKDFKSDFDVRATLNGVNYLDVLKALADAQSGDTVVMTYKYTSNVTLPEGVTLKAATSLGFSKTVNAASGAEYYVSKTTVGTDDVYTTVKNPVAKVGNYYYMTFEDAFAQCSTRGDDEYTKVTILVSSDEITIPEGKSAELSCGSGVVIGKVINNGYLKSTNGSNFADTEIENNGTFKFMASAVKSIVNNEGATVTFNGASSTYKGVVTGTIVNHGTMNVNNSMYPYYFIGAITNDGELTITSGCFAEDAYNSVKSSLPEGYVFSPVAGDTLYGTTYDKFYKVMAADGIVAQVITGDDVFSYDDVAKAIEDCPTGGTVKLVKDASVSYSGYLSEIKDKDLILDLNGKKLTLSATGFFLNNTKLTVTGNGTMESMKDGYTSGNGYCFVVYGGSELTIENGTFKALGTVAQMGYESTPGKIFVEGGEFTTTQDHDGKYWILNKLGGIDGNVISVTGGTFHNFDPANPSTENPGETLVAEGYESNLVTENTWTVSKKLEPVAKIGETKYYDLAEALNACGENETVELLCDIDLSGKTWTPVCTATRSGNTVTGGFKGTFDGKDFIIKGLAITTAPSNGDQGVGLFSGIDGGTVKNVKLENVSITASGNEATGALAGFVSNGGKVENVTVVSGSVSAATCGGIVGRMIIDGTISGCTNNATVTGSKGNTGGIVGAAYYNASGKTMTISGCTNNGAVSAPGYLGGIAGLSCADVSGCTNTGAVTGGNSTSVGGIVGEQQNAGSIKNCNNSGTIKGASGGYGSGGIVGWARYSGAAGNYPVKEIIEVTGNTNSGSVTGGNDAGGIIGTLYNAGIVTDNTNTAAKLSGASFAAGIVGNFQTNESTGSVDVPKNSIVIGRNTSSTTDITANCTDPIIYGNGNIIAQIGELQYSCFDTALQMAAAVKDGSTVEIKLLKSFAEVLPQRQDAQGHWGYIFENVNVTITADSAVVADLTDTNYHAALIAGDDAVVTIAQNVTLKNCGSVGSYHYVEEHTNAEGNGVFNINGTVTPVHAHLDGITMNIGTTGKFGWADGSSSSMFPMEENGTLNITGTLTAVPAEAPADYQFKAMCFGTSMAGTKNIVLNTTAAHFTQFGFANGDVNTVNLTVNHSYLNNRDGMTVNGATALTADSKIVVTGGNASFGNITVDMDGATAASYTVIDVKGANKTGTYGTVTLTNNTGNYVAKVVDNDLVIVKPVAQIGNTKYATLADAVAAANQATSWTQIYLIADTAVDETIELNNVNGNGTTLHTNGHVLTANAPVFKVTTALTYLGDGTGALTDLKADHLFVANGGTIKINQDSVFTSNSVNEFLNEHAYYLVENDGKYTVTPYQVDTAKAAGFVAMVSIDSTPNYFATVQEAADAGNKTSATLIADVTNGSIVAEKYFTLYTEDIFWNAYNYSGSITVPADMNLNISGGTYNKNGKVDLTNVVCGELYLMNNANVTVANGMVQTIDVNSGTLNITGGIFGVDPTDYVADGYKVVNNTDSETKEAYPFKVVVDDSVAKNVTTGVKYMTLTEALAAAKADEEVELLKDITGEAFIVVESGITLDLAGHNITGAKFIYVTGSMIDSAALNARGIISASNYFFDKKSQTMTPVFNATKKGYSLFALQYSTTHTIVDDKGQIAFSLAPSDGERNAAWKLLTGDYTKYLKVVLTVSWSDDNKDNELDFIWNKDFINSVVETQLKGQAARFTASITGATSGAKAQPKFVICDANGAEIYSFDGPTFTFDGTSWSKR